MVKTFFLLICIILIFTGIFYYPIVFLGKIPIPADTIVGMYHPWRDVVWGDYTAGVPFKNFLITDPVRQLYPWRYLAIESFKMGELPLWNPYEMTGVPLLANPQTAFFYPLNVIFSIFSFTSSWTILVMAQTFLAILFMTLYLINLRMHSAAALFGGVIFAFSGFSISWLEWNTMMHTVLWLPLILLSLEKLHAQQHMPLISTSMLTRKEWNVLIWPCTLLVSLVSSFFAGHIQLFVYVGMFVFAYVILKVRTNIATNRIFLQRITLVSGLFFCITSIQWYLTIQFILLSDRSLQSMMWNTEGWFIPFRHLIQFIIPDFFGNPSTLNYWGTWNYGEMIGYIGITPFIFALMAVFFIKSKKTRYCISALIVLLVLSTENPVAEIPFALRIPFFSTAQPTRLIALIDFILAVLAAAGLDYFLDQKSSHKYKKIIISTAIITCLFFTIQVVTAFIARDQSALATYAQIGLRNSLFPAALLSIFWIYIILYAFFIKKHGMLQLQRLFILIIFIITLVDLFRMGYKFLSFSDTRWLYPPTKITTFLQKQSGKFRIMTTDPRILPPNFPTMYHIETIEGYNPLYLSSFGNFISAMERNSVESSPIFFNRIIAPRNIASGLINIANVQYILTFNTLESPNFTLIMEEGKTKLYRNEHVMSRAYYVKEVQRKNDIEALKAMIDPSEFTTDVAYVNDRDNFADISCNEICSVTIDNYSNNRVTMRTYTPTKAFLVLSDTYYPSWKAYIDGKPAKIYKTNITFRGLLIPPGNHQVELKTEIFGFL